MATKNALMAPGKIGPIIRPKIGSKLTPNQAKIGAKIFQNLHQISLQTIVKAWCTTREVEN
jgi:hypothetical protein